MSFTVRGRIVWTTLCLRGVRGTGVEPNGSEFPPCRGVVRLELCSARERSGRRVSRAGFRPGGDLFAALLCEGVVCFPTPSRCSSVCLLSCLSDDPTTCTPSNAFRVSSGGPLPQLNHEKTYRLARLCLGGRIWGGVVWELQRQPGVLLPFPPGVMLGSHSNSICLLMVTSSIKIPRGFGVQPKNVRCKGWGFPRRHPWNYAGFLRRATKGEYRST